jgi:hypothetical protein
LNLPQEAKKAVFMTGLFENVRIMVCFPSVTSYSFTNRCFLPVTRVFLPFYFDCCKRSPFSVLQPSTFTGDPNNYIAISYFIVAVSNCDVEVCFVAQDGEIHSKYLLGSYPVSDVGFCFSSLSCFVPCSASSMD